MSEKHPQRTHAALVYLKKELLPEAVVQAIGSSGAKIQITGSIDSLEDHEGHIYMIFDVTRVEVDSTIEVGAPG